MEVGPSVGKANSVWVLDEFSIFVMLAVFESGCSDLVGEFRFSKCRMETCFSCVLRLYYGCGRPGVGAVW